jgi:deoxyribodipyrimidine photo-lyase
VPIDSKNSVVIFWFRRDLRLDDNVGLSAALSESLALGLQVLPLFIFDTDILQKLSDKGDLRVQFIHETLAKLNHKLADFGSGILFECGQPVDVWRTILSRYTVAKVYCNRDFEPRAIERDLRIEKECHKAEAEFRTFKDHVIFEKLEVAKDDGLPYTVFTPYSRKWKSLLKESDTKPNAWVKYKSTFLKFLPKEIPTLEALGFENRPFKFPSHNPAEKKIAHKIAHYGSDREMPSIDGTTHLGLHLRFGTVSIRDLVRQATSDIWLNELIWREFFMQILWNFPHVVGRAFKPDYEQIEYRHDEKEFKRWCEGKTGYPLVDAGMRELNATGFMHGRVRMVAASFLVKHLLIDWRWGEAYFARKLLDFELASNNGNWQWVAGTGCDAAPYFRVFSPLAQQKKFDPNFEYIKKWIPEFATDQYAAPMIDHVEARTRVLRVYKAGLTRKAPKPSR